MKKRVDVRPPRNWAEMSEAHKDEWNRRSAEAIDFPQRPDQRRPERPVLLAVDQPFEGPGL